LLEPATAVEATRRRIAWISVLIPCLTFVVRTLRTAMGEVVERGARRRKKCRKIAWPS